MLSKEQVEHEEEMLGNLIKDLKTWRKDIKSLVELLEQYQRTGYDVGNGDARKKGLTRIRELKKKINKTIRTQETIKTKE